MDQIMDTIERYRQLAETILLKYAHRPSHGDIEPEMIISADRNHFELMFVRWDGSVIHIDIINDKIWIQHDGTSPGVALELVEAGVPRTDIVLGFRPAYVRQYTDYAVG